MSDGRAELEEIKGFIRSNRELLKPMFGMMFWQLQALEEALDPDEFIKQGLSLTMVDAEDEVLGAFLGSYVKLWHNAGDFNAASRFVCSCLEITGDELLQTRQLYLDAKKNQSTQ